MKKKVISMLSICALGIAGFACGNLQSTQVSALETTVYVSSSGNDNGAGTDASPYATLNKALEEVADGGTVVLKDTVVLSNWAAHGKTVTVTGGGLDVSGLAESDFNDGKGTKMKEIVINDNVTFTDISWTVDSTLETFIYANGYKMTVGTGVSYSSENVRLFGGGKEGSTVASTDLTVLSGTYNYIYGGSLRSTVTGNTNLTVGGTVNNNASNIDSQIKSGHEFIYSVLGGGHVDIVKGSTNVYFQDSAKAVYVAGGSYGYGCSIAKGSNVSVKGGMLMGVYGSCLNGGHSGSGANVRIEDGTMQQVFGGSEGQIVTGDVDVRIVGGSVTRRIYAGSYGDGSTKYVVKGKVSLELGGDVDISFSASQSDKGIYGRSRYNGDEENCQIVFTSQAAYEAYKNQLGGKDWGASYVMGSTAAADEYHYYTYSADGNVITQACAYHDTLSATATIGLDESISLQYTGNAITPIGIDCSADWEYDKPMVAYGNNVECGKANYTVTAGQVCVEDSFIIVKTPVVLGGSVRLSAPSGLRFQSKVPSELANSGATFGTLYIPKDVLGANELTVATPTVENVQQTKWATDSVRENNPQQYEEGCEYFNAVLTEIPEEHYDKVIVARSYVYANGQYYYSDTVERSIAQVSACALKDGYTNQILYDYVDKALADSTVSMESKVTVYEGESYQLTLTGNKGYAVIWSTDSDILTVDENGKITVGEDEGNALVMAKIGSQIVKCTVTVKQRWTGYY